MPSATHRSSPIGEDGNQLVHVTIWPPTNLSGSLACIADVSGSALHRSISYASTLGLPIYITENGIPAAADDPNRAKWINGCLDVVRSLQ